ncbi:hypothetical protein BJ508DRAFT_414376 [Ascobolus immersus RN42]|uniref:polynucleotide adenylyltransferase n=1 Tax=Ascobolus immersus RN42 TaxID=1160509 RepID=A0A3N4IBV9_ASCIM|nr:hypothetical protein BJ508DRAFT_414376 [Ascobolus immersus RN42]
MASEDSQDVSLTEALSSVNAFPTNTKTQHLSDGFSRVREILNYTPTDSADATWQRLNLGLLQIVPVGSYGYGLHDDSSDLDLTVVGGLGAPIFYRIVQLRVRMIGIEYGVKVSKFVDAKDASMLELEVSFKAGDGSEGSKGSVMVDLHYAQAPGLLSRWNEIADLPSEDIALALPAGTRRKINAYRDMVYILRRIPNKETFALAYRFIRTWAKRRGLYSSRFGLLSGFHITLLLFRLIKKQAVAEMVEKESSASQILALFFNEYAEFDWEKEEVVDPEIKLVNHKRSWTEPISILTPNSPHFNVSANATKHSVYALQKELGRAKDLVNANAPWENLFGSDPQQTALEMLSEYTNFIKIDLSFWGSSIGRGKNFVGWTESRIVHLLIEIQTYFPSLNVRLFPTRFKLPTLDNAQPTELTSFYLLGVHNTAPATTTSSTDPSSKRIQENKFLLVLTRFTDAVKRNDLIYNPSEAYISCSYTRSLPKEGIELDNNQTWDFLGDASTFSTDSTDLDLEEAPSRPEEPNEDLKALESTSYDLASLPPKTSPLRPAHDVLNRLRWDQSYDVRDYVVGYDDRFLGIMEMGVEAWSNEKTEEEWIPMHRVVYFKRVSDGVIVWDRRVALDGVFGSGRGMFESKPVERVEEEVSKAGEEGDENERKEVAEEGGKEPGDVDVEKVGGDKGDAVGEVVSG